MNLSRHLNRHMLRLLMGAVLFAQWAMPASAYAVNAAPTSVSRTPHAMSMHCHEQQEPRASACLTHCSQADQVNLDQVVNAAPVAAGWQVAVPPVHSISRPSGLSRVTVDTGPPIPIRFCSLLN